MKDFAVFWGCTIQARFPFLEKSTRMVFEEFKLPYREIDGFTCCPEKSLVNNVDHSMFVVTAARNVALADEHGLDVVSPCTGCVSNLASVKGELKSYPGKKAQVNSFLAEVGHTFEGEANIMHLVPFFHDKVGALDIKKKIKRGFDGMKVAVHYGCHMIRPSHALRNDDPITPVKFDNLIRTLGAESVEFDSKMMCCGQGLDRVDQHENALHMARTKLNELKAIGADALVLCCPSCFLQFDNNQAIMQRRGERLGIPVIYFTELLGLALGYGAEELGMKLHRVSVEPFIEKWESLAKPEARSATIAEGLNIAGPLF